MITIKLNKNKATKIRFTMDAVGVQYYDLTAHLCFIGPEYDICVPLEVSEKGKCVCKVPAIFPDLERCEGFVQVKSKSLGYYFEPARYTAEFDDIKVTIDVDSFHAALKPAISNTKSAHVLDKAETKPDKIEDKSDKIEDKSEDKAHKPNKSGDDLDKKNVAGSHSSGANKAIDKPKKGNVSDYEVVTEPKAPNTKKDITDLLAKYRADAGASAPFKTVDTTNTRRPSKIGSFKKPTSS